MYKHIHKQQESMALLELIWLFTRALFSSGSDPKNLGRPKVFYFFQKCKQELDFYQMGRLVIVNMRLLLEESIKTMHEMRF